MSSPPPGRKCLEGSTTVSDSDSEDEPKLPLNQFYPYIRCALCCGFLIDATTITECLHTFCKSCILKHFFYSNRCPTCSVVVHQTQPLYNIRPDRQLQDIVYKMVPFLEESEREQMSNFYEERGLEVPKPVVVSPAGPVLRRQKKDNVPQSAFTIPPELDLSLLLEFVGSTSESDSEWEPARTQSGVDESSSSSSDEEDPTSFRGRARARERARARRRSRRSSSRGETSTPGVERWCGVDEPDITPPQPTFRPSRTPGSQLIMTATYSAFELFQLFFTNTILQRILYNTNQHGRAHYSSPSKPWKDINLQDMYSFLSIVLYMGFVKCTALTDYWRGGNLYNLPFPQKVISRSKWLRILQALHLSSAEDDAANEEKRGTPAFDRLGKIKPLYDEIREACRRNYHPGQEISIDERMVASKACVLFKQYMKGKPVRWGFKLFVLADSSNGYTWDFFVYEGKINGASGKGLSYDVVMRLMDTSFLGTGYKLFVDNFYTSPTLFRDLLQQKIWACGTIRTNRVGYPKTKLNALDPTSPRGSIRWLRTSSLLFVQWRDTRDVFLCSTIHTAHGNETVSRRVKDNSGRWTVKNVPLPPAVKDYNRCMGGVDVSDALIGYYQVLHKTHKWYKTFFYHFLDIAVVNAFLLYKDLCKAKGEAPMPQKAFREILAQQLWQVGSQRSTPGPSLQPSGSSRTHHRLVYISGDRTGGRLKCRKCHAKTAVKCSTCDKPLCFVPERDCYNQWHIENNM